MYSFLAMPAWDASLRQRPQYSPSRIWFRGRDRGDLI